MFREDVALLDVGWITDNNSITISDNIRNHIVLLRENAFIKNLCYFLGVVFCFYAKGNDIIGNRIDRNRTGKADKALFAGSSAAVADKYSRSLSLVITVDKAFQRKDFVIPFFIPRYQKTV